MHSGSNQSKVTDCDTIQVSVVRGLRNQSRDGSFKDVGRCLTNIWVTTKCRYLICLYNKSQSKDGKVDWRAQPPSRSWFVRMRQREPNIWTDKHYLLDAKGMWTRMRTWIGWGKTANDVNTILSCAGSQCKIQVTSVNDTESDSNMWIQDEPTD